MHFAFALFRPSLALVSYLEWKDMNLADNDSSLFEKLLVGE